MPKKIMSQRAKKSRKTIWGKTQSSRQKDAGQKNGYDVFEEKAAHERTIIRFLFSVPHFSVFGLSLKFDRGEL
ncbi:hypothetical protein HUU05_12285 [candidate division KSB1 bacterium]|nr:hypothetical protein [candidate division KSB1 bacterium]